jgi:hypothetical protein
VTANQCDPASARREHNVQIVELLVQKTPLFAAFTMKELKSNYELFADFGDVAAEIVRSAAKSQVITNNLNEEVNTWKERYDSSTAK